MFVSVGRACVCVYVCAMGVLRNKKSAFQHRKKNFRFTSFVFADTTVRKLKLFKWYNNKNRSNIYV